MNPDAPSPPEESFSAAAENDSAAGRLLALRGMRQAQSGRRAGRRLFNISLAGVTALLGYAVYSNHVADPVHLYLGMIIFALAVAPALEWARRGEYGLPVFEAFMLPGVNTFAMPLLNGKDALTLYSPEVITTAALGVILFQAACNLCFFLLKVRPKRTRTWRREIVSKDISKLLGYGMIVTTVYTIVLQFTDWIPNDLGPEIRAVCYGVGIIATFVQSRRWGEDELPHHDRIIFLVQLILQVVLNWVALFLVQGVSILLLSLIGYVSGSRKIPFIPILLSLPIIGVLYNGKAMMRAKYWNSEAAPVTITEVPAFFSEWVQDGVQAKAEAQLANDKSKGGGVLDRTSLIQIICLVVSISPDKKPFLNGETYLQIPGQFVPRFFWKDKPLGHISTYTLSLYYGLQGSMEEAQQTTIGFGLVAESYANFGLPGMVALGIIFGTFFKCATGWARESPVFSYPGLFLIVLMAWTFQTELPLSAWLASLWQACLSVLGLPMIMRNFFK